MKKTILSARGLCKSFAHNGVQSHILSNLDLDVYEGDFTVIMGASGSGKSTLLYSLSGMDRATGGQVIYGGRDIVKMSEKELSALRCGDFGFVFQQMHLVSSKCQRLLQTFLRDENLLRSQHSVYLFHLILLQL